MEFDEPQALVHLLWLGASVDKKIADSEREYIQKVCSHEKIPLELEELQKHHENNRFDQIYQKCVLTFKVLPLDDRLKAVVYLFEMLLSDDLFLDEEDHFFKKVLRDFNISEEQFRHAPAVFLNQPHVF